MNSLCVGETVAAARFGELQLPMLEADGNGLSFSKHSVTLSFIIHHAFGTSGGLAANWRSYLDTVDLYDWCCIAAGFGVKAAHMKR